LSLQAWGITPKIKEVDDTITPNVQPRVGVDDLLDAAVAAWTALRLHKGNALHVCSPERDAKGLAVTIYY
jgi:predicted RNase H-like nuclease